MGSTLEHGIYLPSEGEKNCYQGLAGNWNKVDGALGDIAELKQSIESKFTKEIVTELPTEDINPFCIYMILKTDPETDNVYDEWVYINNSWEYLGNTKVDMTQYYTKQEVNQLPAVASGVTATKVGNYDTHIANGDIHVTASDKTKWTNSANTHVLRLALSALTPSTSDNSFSNLDDATALKVGDKVMDTAGVLFEVTAIDTQNSTFTIGTALIDLAQDSDIVHNSGDETISGFKTFSSTIRSTAYPSIRMYLSDDEWNVQPASGKQSEIRFTDKNSVTVSYFAFQHRTDSAEPFRTCWRQHKMDGTSGYYSVDFNNKGDFYPENNNAINLGGSGNRWKSVYATNYYYGLNNVEFSTKFVTTDTAQDIEGNKNFKGLLTTIPSSSLWPTVSNTTNDITTLDRSVIHIEYKASGQLTDLSGGAWNVAELGYGCFFFRVNSGTDIRYKNLATGDVNRIPVVSGANRFINDVTPNQDNTYNLGSSSLRWKTINGLNPSSLGMPDFNNGIDISSYITDLTGASNINKYTPPVNGWISIGISNAEFIELYVPTLLMGGTFTKSTANNNAQAFMPVVANKEVKIALKGSSIGWAKFFPCQGNV